ncbi:hypothetical protein AVDCRST_MAG94-4960 [uncultured Leptolyngbya sp.]|uniref:Uncharacterized protein n=1 Tax=uncultured Leptolyngbya sp. TaxID=332963 RepID=A0A6J4NA54_9CYAN|nr:hypothetical protein AVDCRST_MAG94-4960 [uncultured Leptolyngbya sp.]
MFALERPPLWRQNSSNVLLCRHNGGRRPLDLGRRCEGPKAKLWPFSQSHWSKPTFGWEHDHSEIVKVCHKVIGSAPSDEGKQHFFYQTMDGYWDSKEKKFQSGKHPRGFIWNKSGGLVTNMRGQASMTALQAVQMDFLEWKEAWRSEVKWWTFFWTSTAQRRCGVWKN